MIEQRSDYTFKHNRSLGRHGWLRLTPAYSVKLVHELISEVPFGGHILDPFSGTATTGVVAAEHGLDATLFDINPFLVWLGNAKLQSITQEEEYSLRTTLNEIAAAALADKDTSRWVPPLKNIERWWSPETLDALARLRHAILQRTGEPAQSRLYALLWIAFARVTIEYSAADFNHVSVSFKETAPTYAISEVTSSFARYSEMIISDATNLLNGSAKVFLHDSTKPFAHEAPFDAIITSPPYPNRISYVRELRPYMFWLGFLSEAREAGELDWQAVGGTWGIATSRLQTWKPSSEIRMPSLLKVTEGIANSDKKYGELLSTYVKKYFYDMDIHFSSMRRLLAPGAQVHYIIGNSVFYKNHVPTAELYEEALKAYGFTNVQTKIIRKRNSNKKLFEFCTSASFGEPSAKTSFFNGSNFPKSKMEFSEKQMELFEFA
jgi:DNA modification methylase